MREAPREGPPAATDLRPYGAFLASVAAKRSVIAVQVSLASMVSSRVAVPMIWTIRDAVPSFFGSLMIVKAVPSRPLARHVIRFAVPLTRTSPVMRSRTSWSAAAKSVHAR
jgi:hypothetical protein